MIIKTNKIIPTAQATTKPMASGRMTQFGEGKVWSSTDTFPRISSSHEYYATEGHRKQS